MRATLMAVLVVLVTASGLAAAQKPSQKFIDEYQAGIDAYRLGHYDEARTHLEAAKAIDPTLPGPWRFLAAVAQGEERWADCVAGAREAIRLNPMSAEIAATRTLHDDCRASWGKPPFEAAYDEGTGAIAVTTDQVGATVEINGLKYGSTPMQARALPVGDVEVKVSKPGYLDASRKLAVVPQIVTDVDFVLEVDPDAKTGSDLGLSADDLTIGWIKVETTTPGAEIRIDDKPPVTDEQGRFEIEAGPHQVTVTAPGHEPMRKNVRVTRGQLVTVRAELRSQVTVDRSRTRGTIAVGTGVGIALIGAVTGMLALRANDEARDLWVIETTRPPNEDTSAIHPIRTRADIQAAVDRGKTLGLVSNIAYGVAVVAVGVGAYFLVKARPRGDRAALTVVPIFDGEGGRGAAALGEVRW